MNTNADIPQEEWERMEGYLLQTLPPEETLKFSARLAADAELNNQLTEVRLLLTGVQEAALQQKLEGFHSGLAKEKTPVAVVRKMPAMQRWLVAACVLLVAGLTGWWTLLKPGSNEQLFAAYFKPDPGLITAMSATTHYAFERAMIDYKNGDYPAAITGWDSLQKAQPANDTLNYFLGVAHLANNNGKAAIAYLQKATTVAGFFKEDAWWYLGLALLKERRKREAITAIGQSLHPGKAALLQSLEE